MPTSKKSSQELPRQGRYNLNDYILNERLIFPVKSTRIICARNLTTEQ